MGARDRSGLRDCGERHGLLVEWAREDIGARQKFAPGNAARNWQDGRALCSG